MKVRKTNIQDLLVIEPRVFDDPRGYFFESYHKARFQEHGIAVDFLQDNLSRSQKDVLRGLHFQNPPFAQGKLVHVLQGAVLDVAVDLRKNSPTYGEHYSIELSEANKTMFWIPAGFAHGFLTLADQTIFSYKCTNYYHPESEETILWNDPDIAINWPADKPLLSEKDLKGISFQQFQSKF